MLTSKLTKGFNSVDGRGLLTDDATASSGMNNVAEYPLTKDDCYMHPLATNRNPMTDAMEDIVRDGFATVFDNPVHIYHHNMCTGDTDIASYGRKIADRFDYPVAMVLMAAAKIVYRWRIDNYSGISCRVTGYNGEILFITDNIREMTHLSEEDVLRAISILAEHCIIRMYSIATGDESISYYSIVNEKQIFPAPELIEKLLKEADSVRNKDNR